MAEKSEYPKRLYSNVMQRYFWVDSERVEPFNGEACYCFDEIQMIAGTFPKLTTTTLIAIYDIKASTGARLTDLTPFLAEQKPLSILEETIEMLKKLVIKSHNVKHL